MKKLFFILTSALLLIPEFINAGTPIIIIREGAKQMAGVLHFQQLMTILDA